MAHIDAGKTTTTAKIAGKLLKKGRKPLLVACDIYRPAAIEQLKINGDKQGVEVFSMGNMSGISTLEIITYHALAVGFICMGLKSSGNKKHNKKRTTEIFNTGVTTVTTYLIDGDPKGTQYAFISNKICQMFVVPRSNLSYLNTQEKLQKPAFYILYQRSTNENFCFSICY